MGVLVDCWEFQRRPELLDRDVEGTLMAVRQEDL